jgi:hypothetical protein
MIWVEQKMFVDFEKFKYAVIIPRKQFQSAYDYCCKTYGLRYGISNQDGTWDWFESPLFMTEEDAVMFRLGFGHG